MDNKEPLDKLEEICSKEENIRKILQAKTKDDIKPLFEGSGIELTDERFDILKKVYMGIVEKLKNMNEEELGQISGGKWERATIGSGEGLSVGTPLGALLGAGVSLAVEIKNASDDKHDRDFLRTVCRVFSRTGLGAVCGAAVGAGVGSVIGAGQDLVDEGERSLRGQKSGQSQ